MDVKIGDFVKVIPPQNPTDDILRYDLSLSDKFRVYKVYDDHVYVEDSTGKRSCVPLRYIEVVHA